MALTKPKQRNKCCCTAQMPSTRNLDITGYFLAQCVLISVYSLLLANLILREIGVGKVHSCYHAVFLKPFSVTYNTKHI